MRSLSPGPIARTFYEYAALHRGRSIINKLIYYYNLHGRSCVQIVANFNARCEIAQRASRCIRIVVSKTPLTEHVVVRPAPHGMHTGCVSQISSIYAGRTIEFIEPPPRPRIAVTERRRTDERDR